MSGRREPLFISPTLFADRLGTVAGLLYLFGGWLVIIGFAFLLARRLRKTGAGGDEAG